MALRPCRVCGAPVSTAARQCPQCGTDDPTSRRRVGCAVFLLCGLLILVYGYLVGPLGPRWSAPQPATAVTFTPRPVPGPPDPNRGLTGTVFTMEFARHVPQSFSIKDLQTLAGSPGKIIFRQADPKDPQWVYQWVGTDGTRRSDMLATVRPSGFIEVQISTDRNVSVVLNSQGEFYCDPIDCRPRG